MGGLIARRLATLVPLLLGASIVVFGLVLLLPGDPAVTIAGGADADPAQIQRIRVELGLDRPLYTRYADWLGGVLQGDLGTSLVSGQAVFEQILQRLPVTFGLAVAAMGVGLALGVPAGIVAAIRPGSVADRFAMLGASLGIAVPNFWLAMILVAVFAVGLGWLPPLGYTPFTDSPVGWLRTMVLPATALGTWAAAYIARQLRASLQNSLEAPYIRTAWAKGVSPRVVTWKHALKNAATPVVTILGVLVSILLGGAVIIEQIFTIPGLGSYLLNGILNADLPLIQGVGLVFVVLQVTLNLLVDLSYGLLNPRMRVS